MIKLILLDVNDNAPEMPLPSAFRPTVSENSEIVSYFILRSFRLESEINIFLEQGQLVGTIVATDIDDQQTPNAQVGYAILAVVPGTLPGEFIT